eukprot:CAMPEP_0179074790 /NCGR_PEP_ID=MMETSP0796-20121207/33265_1 /TAXON_ID=73915 /ORGANISM="Pyrodinium bahamense, Strain pbaha01" /LENGTH=89 /DNA_ID=CAMNT_0020772019 /DNA_START=290 /DNA_END=559 /DNA_ORIENTATION=+
MRDAAVGFHCSAQRQLVTPRPVLCHLLQEGIKCVVTGKEHAEEVPVLPHVGNNGLPGNIMVPLRAKQVEGNGTELTVAVTLHVMRLQAE